MHDTVPLTTAQRVHARKLRLARAYFFRVVVPLLIIGIVYCGMVVVFAHRCVSVMDAGGTC